MPNAIALAMVAVLVAGAEPAQPQPQLDPLDFFTGDTRGDGTIKVIMKAPTSISNESHGRPDGSGGLILDQKVRETGKPVRLRRWQLRPTSKTTLEGTVTDAASPIIGDLKGNRLHLKYRMKGGLAAEQYMYLQPDGRTLLNRMIVRKMGIIVARVDETIRKLP